MSAKRSVGPVRSAKPTRTLPQSAPALPRALSLVFADDGAGTLEVLSGALQDSGEVLEAQTVASLLDAYLDEAGRLRPAPADDTDLLALARSDDERARFSKLASMLESARAHAWAENTLTSYGSHVRAWRDWCDQHDLPALPLVPGMVALHLISYAFVWDFDAGEFLTDEDGRPVPRVVAATLSQRLSALNKLAEFTGTASPGAHPGVEEVMRGLRRLLLTSPDLAKQALDLKLIDKCLTAATGLSLRTARDRAATLLRARTGATAGQLASLHWADITLTEDSVAISLPKTHRYGKALEVEVPLHEDSRLCLVRALRDVRSLAPALRQVLTKPDGKPMTRQAFHSALGAVWDELPGMEDDRLSEVLGEHAPAVHLMAARDRALLLTGFYTALRRSNLSALNWGDVSDMGEDGLALRVRKSKTDQEGKGRMSFVPQAAEGNTKACPASALREYKEALEADLGRQLDENEPVFVSLASRGRARVSARGKAERLSGDGINDVVQRLVVAAGIVKSRKGDRNPYGAHSLRAGFITEALRDAKLTIPEVQDVTGHKSVDVLMRYSREVNAAKSNGSRKLLGKLSEAS